VRGLTPDAAGRRLANPLGMPSSSSRLAVSSRHFLVGVVSCVAALALFYWAFSLWAASRFAEPWAAEYPVIGLMGPFAAIALLSGLLIGALTAALTRANSLRIVVWSGVVVCLLSFGAAVVAGGLKWATSEGTVLLGPFVAGGLVLGALLVRKFRHA
jgi:hypothetical protein